MRERGRRERESEGRERGESVFHRDRLVFTPGSFSGSSGSSACGGAFSSPLASVTNGILTESRAAAPPAPPGRKMKRLCRRLAVAVAVLVWLGALVYLLALSRRGLPELGAGAGGGGGGGGGGETVSNQVK